MESNEQGKEWVDAWKAELMHAVAISEWPSKGYKNFVDRLVVQAEKMGRKKERTELVQRLTPFAGTDPMTFLNVLEEILNESK